MINTLIGLMKTIQYQKGNLGHIFSHYIFNVKADIDDKLPSTFTNKICCMMI